MLRRRQGREASTVDLAAAEEVWASVAPEGNSSTLLDALTACYETLAGRAREAIDRCYKNSESREEIAAAMEVTPDGVKSMLRRTRIEPPRLHRTPLQGSTQTFRERRSRRSNRVPCPRPRGHVNREKDMPPKTTACHSNS